jgi:hypothetical protein
MASPDASDRVAYCSYGSNLNFDRFMTYIRGGTVVRCVDMVVPAEDFALRCGCRHVTPSLPPPSLPPRGLSQPGNSRLHKAAVDTSPPVDPFTMIVPHTLKFCRESGNWGGGVGFLDVYAPAPLEKAAASAAIATAAALAAAVLDPAWTILRCYNVSLAQFNHVVAEENGGDDARTPAVVLTAADVADLVARGPGAARNVAPGWYGTVVYLGDAPDGGGEAVDGGASRRRVPLLTFTANAPFFCGRPAHNPPSPAYLAVLLAGLQEAGLGERQAREYLVARGGAARDGAGTGGPAVAGAGSAPS